MNRKIMQVMIEMLMMTALFFCISIKKRCEYEKGNFS